MIKIKFKDKPDNIVTWGKDSYDDYMYDKKYFIIMNHNEWVGFYNLDSLDYIVIEGEH